MCIRFCGSRLDGQITLCIQQALGVYSRDVRFMRNLRTSWFPLRTSSRWAGWMNVVLTPFACRQATHYTIRNRQERRTDTARERESSHEGEEKQRPLYELNYQQLSSPSSCSMKPLQFSTLTQITYISWKTKTEAFPNRINHFFWRNDNITIWWSHLLSNRRINDILCVCQLYELFTMCSPSIKAAIEGVELSDFYDISLAGVRLRAVDGYRMSLIGY